MEQNAQKEREKILEIKNLCMEFPAGKKKTVKALNNVTFDIYKGENFGLVGESGCGKSTLAKLLFQYYPDYSGDILFNGRQVRTLDRTALYRRVGYIAQTAYLFHDTIRNNICLHEDFPDEQLAHAIAAAGLTDWVASLPDGLDTVISENGKNLSGGQRQRIGIARALAMEPKFLVMDEPISALDVSIQAQVINMFEELQEKLGVAYLFIAHDLLVVHHISDRIAVMYLGRIVEIADSNELNDNPMHPYTQSLLSAVPYPDPKMAKERQRIVLEGDVPSPLHMPSGCAFRTRCRYATEKCAQECPSLTDRGNGHQVACWNK